MRGGREQENRWVRREKKKQGRYGEEVGRGGQRSTKIKAERRDYIERGRGGNSKR